MRGRPASLASIRAVAIAVSLSACGGTVATMSSTGTTSGAGGVATTHAQSSSSASSSSSSASVGVASSSTGAGGATTCVKQPFDPDAGFHPTTCADLKVLTVSDPVLEVDAGDGKLHPGSVGTLTVNLNEIAGVGFSAYPEVIFSSKDPGVTVTNGAQFYAILACQTVPSSTLVTIANSVAPGTTVHVVAQAGMLNGNCTNGYAITVPIVIE
jgi:hypothetical protein